MIIQSNEVYVSNNVYLEGKDKKHKNTKLTLFIFDI